MSVAPIACESCGVEGEIARAGMFPEDCDEATYGVGWRCPSCGKLSLDLCPRAAVEPTATSCLNCGTELSGDGEACGGCGMSRAEAIDFLRVSNDPSVAEAEDAFERGLFRHGFALLDAILQRDPKHFEAWKRKGLTYQQ